MPVSLRIALKSKTFRLAAIDQKIQRKYVTALNIFSHRFSLSSALSFTLLKDATKPLTYVHNVPAGSFLFFCRLLINENSVTSSGAPSAVDAACGVPSAVTGCG
jgi:hypothetical protein